MIRHGKFHVYDLVRSHGIEIAEQFGRWDDPREIPWVDLPDLVVVKSERGSTARGVIPLRRCDGGRTIITHAGKVLTGEQLSERLVALVEAGRISGRFGAEEFLDEDGTGTRLPMDIKVYTFYGEAPMALLRRVPTHGDLTATFRMVDRDGRDVGDVYSGQPVDQNMELPSRLDEVFETAERLSIALRAPYSRIDFYRIRDRIVFGELTPRPGGPQWFGPEVDAMLGDQWERSTARLDATSRPVHLHKHSGGPSSRIRTTRPRSRCAARACRCSGGCGSARCSRGRSPRRTSWGCRTPRR